MSVRVVVVDDQELVRTGFRVILNAEPDIEVVGKASNGREAILVVGNLRPDIVLMDIRMPVLDGLAAIRDIVTDPEARPRVIILTTFDLDEYVYEALRSGASGFLLKEGPTDQLLFAVRVVVPGDDLLAPQITRRLIAEFANRTRPAMGLQQLKTLTPREVEVLRLIAKGLSNIEIADELHVAETTVRTHLARVLAKLDLRNRVQAVVLAYEAGLVHPGVHKDASYLQNIRLLRDALAGTSQSYTADWMLQ